MIFDREFQKVVKNKIKNVGFYEAYMYFKPMDHVLCGFCLSEGRAGINIEKYFFPLFDGSIELNLNFGERIPYPAGYIDFETTYIGDVPLDFVKKIQPHIDDVKKYIDEAYCYNLIVKNDYLTQNAFRSPGLFKSYIAFLIFFEEFDKAAEKINESRKLYSRYPERVVRQLKELEDLLNRDPQLAKKLLLKWEVSMKKMLREYKAPM